MADPQNSLSFSQGDSLGRIATSLQVWPFRTLSECRLDYNQMIAKKKNRQQECRSASKLCWATSGLFASKAAKDNPLQQLKRGTLFNLDLRHSEDQQKADQQQNRQEEFWLNSIKLASEEQQVLAMAPPQPKIRQKSSKQLPVIATLPIAQALNPRTVQSRRCDKMICFEKKLRTTGAWNKANPNRIDSNLSRLASTLNSTHHQLTANDFYRVPGYKDRSFDQSIMSASLDLVACHPNPLANISFMEGLGRERRRENKFWRAVRRRKWNNGEGQHVPQFLMSSLLVEDVDWRGRRS